MPRSQKDVGSGILFILIGAFFAWNATSYQVGTAATMGPGYYPLIVGIALIAVGLAVLGKALIGRDGVNEPIEKMHWRPVIAVVAANVSFGVLFAGIPALGIPSFGTGLAIVALVIISSFASPASRVKETVILSLVLALGTWLVFVVGLNMPLNFLPSLSGT